jgi:hypothetical protein
VENRFSSLSKLSIFRSIGFTQLQYFGRYNEKPKPGRHYNVSAWENRGGVTEIYELFKSPSIAKYKENTKLVYTLSARADIGSITTGGTKIEVLNIIKFEFTIPSR